MSNNHQQQASGPDFIGAGTGSTIEADYNMSVNDVPSDWITAEKASPIGPDTGPLSRSARMGAVPTGSQGTFISNIGALGGGLIGGVAWYALDALDIYQGPWTAVAVGLLIGIAVRAGAGGEAGYRAVLSAAAYLLTLLLVLIAVIHGDLGDIYGPNSDFQLYEQTLISTRLQDPLHLLAYGLGLGVAARIASLRTIRT